MKNKKGFTLIELLAVVVIMGLLIGIAFPTVTKYINETRTTTYSLHEADMKSAAANMMSQCINGDVSGCVPENGTSRTVYLKELIEARYSEKIKDPANADHFCDQEKSYVVVTNSSGNVAELSYEVCLVCENYSSGVCKGSSGGDGGKCDKTTDTTPPVPGEVNGDSTVWTNKDRVVSVTCSDDNCGCKQDVYYKKFTESGKTGTIELEDNAGNKTEKEVNVYIDKIKPTCELAVNGELGKNGWYGNPAPVVTLSIHDNDELSGIETYGMGTSSKNYNFDKSTSFTVSPGITTVYGYVRDNAGNVGTCSIEVKYDDVKPTQDVTFGAQIYPKEDMATKSGSKITVGNFLNEYGKVVGMNVYLSSNSAGMSTSVTGSGVSVNRTISPGVTYMQYTFSANSLNQLIIDFGTSDNANKVSKIELLTDHIGGYYTNKDLTAYVTSRDSISGKSQYTFDNGQTWQNENYKVYKENDSNVNIMTRDIAGNPSASYALAINNIDKLVPNCAISVTGAMGNSGWYKERVTLKLTKTDNGVSGTRNYGLTTSTSVSYNGADVQYQDEDTSSVTWHGYVRDKAGNTKTCSTTFKKDATKPTCEVKPTGEMGTNDWYVSDVKLTLTTDDKTSGVVNYGLTETNSVTYNKTTSLIRNTDTDTKRYYGYVIDEAGNSNTCHVDIKRDATKPTCTVKATGDVGNNNWFISDVNINLITDDNLSGVNSYDLKETSANSYGGTATLKLTTDEKNKTYFGFVKDNAGNTNNCTVDVKRDVTKPTCQVKPTGDMGDNNWYVSDVKLTLTTDDKTSGVVNYGLTETNSVTYNKTISIIRDTDTDTKRYYGFVIDDAGNSNTCNVDIKRDVTKPTCTVKATGDVGNNNWFISDVNINLITNDNLSGVNSYDLKETNSSSYGGTQTIKLTTDQKKKTYYGFVKDKAGNTNTCTTDVKRDTVAPVCGSDNGSTTWTNKSRTVTKNCSDVTSGCVNATYSITYPTSSVKNKKVGSVKIEDNAGLTTTCSSINVYVDTTPPSSCTVDLIANGETIPSGSTTKYDVSFTVKGVDNETDASGIASTSVEVKRGSTSLGNITSTSGQDNGTYTVTPTCVDKAGNSTTGPSKTFTISKEITITYYGNGSTSGSTKTQTCYYNQDCVIQDNHFKKTGYTFETWKTGTSSGTEYKVGSTVKLKSNTNLYAQWRKNKVYIRFSVNYGEITPSTAGGSFTTKTLDGHPGVIYRNGNVYEQSIEDGATLDSNGLADYNNPNYINITRPGFSVNTNAIWRCFSDMCVREDNGSGQTFDQTTAYSSRSFTDLSDGDRTVYLEVLWVPIDYKLIYDSNGGNACDPTSKTVTYSQPYGTLCKPTRTGYTFTGWYTKASGGNEVTASTVMQSTKDVTIYAHWTANEYTLTYNSNGGSACNPQQIKGTYGQTWGISCTPTRTNYTFDGWFDNYSGTGPQITDQTTVTGDLVAYARWRVNTVTLTYDSNGGSACTPGSKTVAIGSTVGDLCKTTRTGYDFEGWYENISDSGTKITSATVLNKNVTVHAKWKTSYVTLTYNSNGGTECSTKTVQYKPGSEIGTLSCSGITKSINGAPHPTVGWYYDTKGENAVNTTDTITKDTTIYAYYRCVTGTRSRYQSKTETTNTIKGWKDTNSYGHWCSNSVKSQSCIPSKYEATPTAFVPMYKVTCKYCGGDGHGWWCPVHDAGDSTEGGGGAWREICDASTKTYSAGASNCIGNTNPEWEKVSK